MYSKGSLDQLSAKISACSWHGSAEFPPCVSRMKTASEVLPLSPLSTEKKKPQPVSHRAGGPKEWSSEALARLTNFTADSISSALPGEPARQTSLSLFFFFVSCPPPNRNHCLCFPSMMMLGC